MNLSEAEVGKECIISDIVTDDEEMKSFLFSLGCYSGEPITVVSRKKKNCVVSIKDGRGSLTLCLPLDFHNPLHYSPLRLIFLSNFYFFSVLFCTLVI